MYSTIIYDLDGTLIDSALTVTTLLNDLREEHGLKKLTVNDYRPWLSIGGKAMVAAALNIPEADAATPLESFRTRYQNIPTDPSIVYSDVRATLSALQSADIKLGLCTNKPRALTTKILAETTLGEFFEFVCAGQDLPTCKPHPDNLNVCLQALKSSPGNSLVIGDSRIDQLLAENCGSDFVFFSGGYDDGVRIDTNMLTIHHHPEILNLFPSIEKGPHRE